jgi:N-acetylglucosaminyldiphosphoundecaprenol N-acetyl-beta-D-mannosaminyltransferase
MMPDAWKQNWLTQPCNGAPPERVNILGVGISAIDMSSAVERCTWLLDARGKGYVCVTGVHGIMEAQRDPGFRDILNRSFLCTPDGMPTVWMGWMRGHSAMRRVYGPDFMLELCRSLVAGGRRHFLYGGAPGTVQRLRHRLERLVPGIEIVGAYTPPFRPLSPAEEDDVIASVAAAGPDIVWVGLSTPKQERFMAHMLPRLETRLMIGVGAAFDIHAGLLRDAPGWVKASGLQWLYRLLLEPRRLWRRYLANNPRFVWQVALQLAGIRKFPLT